MKIAILDDYNNLSPSYTSDLHTKFPSKDFSITVYRDNILPKPDPQLLIDRLLPYDVLVTMRERTPLPKEVLEKLVNLRVILTTGMRNLGIDVGWCNDHGVVVGGTKGSGLPPGAPEDFLPTVQHTWALILSLTNNIPRDQSLISSSPGNSWIQYNPLNTYIGGLTLGILGLGKLGLGVARIGILGFGMKVVAWSPNLSQERVDQACENIGLDPGSIKFVDKSTLFKTSDVLSVHIVLGEVTRGIIGTKELELMKPTSFLINTSRGPLINEDALLEILDKGKIRGAGIDVFDVEPLPSNSLWRTTHWGMEGRSQVVMTPHTGYSFERYLKGMWEETRENLIRVIKGVEVINRLV